jgi:Protein of unknown function (DUF3634)
MDNWLNLLVVAVIGVALYWLVQPRYVFVIRINNSGTRTVRGKVTVQFLQLVEETCGQHGVVRGWVGGVMQRQRVALAFSHNIPAACRQRLRNVWTLHG